MPGAGFPTTRWSLIVGSGSGADARVAWAELAQAYRAPIVAYFRARFGAERAEDLTQAFFAASIDGAWWARADAGQGGFRTFLRMLLARFGARHAGGLANESGESDVESLPDDDGPEAAYERQFAHVLVERAMARLQAGLTEGELALVPFVLDRGDAGDLKAIAARQHASPDAVRQRLHRLRTALRGFLRDEVAALNVDAQGVEGELRSLRARIAGSA